MMQGNDAPVEEGKIYEMTVDAQGAKGDGIAHYEGFVVFVSGAKVGETCKVKINTVKRTFAIGQKE